jgi:hypothetical protein
MDFISASDAVQFLSQAAPPAWVRRTLLWMAQRLELQMFADEIIVKPHTDVLSFTRGLFDKAGEWSGPKMDALIRSEYEADFAEKLIGKSPSERVYDEPHQILGAEGVVPIDPGYVIFYTKFDAEGNKLEALNIDEKTMNNEYFFFSDEWCISEFDDPLFDFYISGLKFEAQAIELMLPTSSLSANIERQERPKVAARIGRPRSWDWDGAMAHIVAKAQTPDGLPTGHGAQAAIEAMIAEWFETETGGSPATSQIRTKASMIMSAISKR